MVADVLARAETAARAKLADLRTALDADLPACVKCSNPSSPRA
jgi:hypothetical protein